MDTVRKISESTEPRRLLDQTTPQLRTRRPAPSALCSIRRWRRARPRRTPERVTLRTYSAPWPTEHAATPSLCRARSIPAVRYLGRWIQGRRSTPGVGRPRQLGRPEPGRGAGESWSAASRRRPEGESASQPHCCASVPTRIVRRHRKSPLCMRSGPVGVGDSLSGGISDRQKTASQRQRAAAALIVCVRIPVVEPIDSPACGAPELWLTSSAQARRGRFPLRSGRPEATRLVPAHMDIIGPTNQYICPGGLTTE